MMVCAMFAKWNDALTKEYSRPLLDTFYAWGRPFWEDVKGHVGCISGQVQHYWHGSQANRRYHERLRPLKCAEFDPRRDLRVRANGLWDWIGDNRLREEIRQYFFRRREDEASLRGRIGPCVADT